MSLNMRARYSIYKICKNLEGFYMKKDFCMMIPNDYLFVDGDDVWLVNRDTNELCNGKLSTGEFEYVCSIPFSGNVGYRMNTFCTKYGDYVICLPDTGKYIFIYNVKQKISREIEIENPKSVRLIVSWGKIFSRQLLVWSRGLKRLIEIELTDMSIKNYYKISEDEDDLFSYEVISIKNSIYFFLLKIRNFMSLIF